MRYGQLTIEQFLELIHKSQILLSDCISVFLLLKKIKNQKFSSFYINWKIIVCCFSFSWPSLFIDSEREVCVTLISKECLQFGGRFCKLQLVIHKVLEKQGPMCGKYWAAHFQQLEKHLHCLDVKPRLYQHKMLVKVTSTIVERENKTKQNKSKAL